MPEVELICLANSRKKGGQCVAGWRTDGGGWVRPVNSIHRYNLEDQTAVRPLDIVRIFLNQPCPTPYQPENWNIGDEPWHLVQRLEPTEAFSILESAIVPGQDLFGSFSSEISRKSLEQNPVSASLALVEPTEIQWNITRACCINLFTLR